MASAEVIQYNLKFTLSEDQTFYSVRKADGVEIGYELRIPAEIEGLPVKEIEAEGFAGDTSINIVIIPESVITIGDRAFKDCTSLQGIVIPRTVKNYGRKIFENVPKTFRILHSEFETSVLSETDDRLAFTLSGDGTFYYVKAANMSISGDVEIPSEYNGLPVKVIENSGFYFSSALTSITIPNSVISIGYYAFSYCSSLTSISIPDSVTSIGGGTFDWCGALTSIIVDPDNAVYKSNGNCLIEIATKKLIKGCNTSIIPNGVTSIESYAFANCSALTSINIPDGVTSIGYSAFYNCYKLTSVIIGNSVTSIGNRAFEGCNKLTSVTIGNGVTSIGYGVFDNCFALASINIPDSVTSIGKYAFQRCSKLTSITIPDSVTSIGDYAFNECSGLTCAAIGNGVTSIGRYAFQSCSGLTSVTIPDGVTSIGNDTFYKCTSLTSITIPDRVTSIGDRAFYGCTSLKTVILGKGLETLYGTSNYNGSFKGCTALTTVINKSNNLVTPNNTYPFYGCNNLTKVYFASTAAGYVDGGTWCDRTLEYLNWNGEDSLMLNAEITSTINLPTDAQGKTKMRSKKMKTT